MLWLMESRLPYLVGIMLLDRIKNKNELTPAKRGNPTTLNCTFHPREHWDNLKSHHFSDSQIFVAWILRIFTAVAGKRRDEETLVHSMDS